MIKKIFGVLAAAAILALLVLTVLHHDNYRSMIWDGADFGPAAAVAEPVAASENTGPGPDRQSGAAPAQPAESLSVEPAGLAGEGVPAADSLRVKE
ncbi:MAG TPA: hypothetical protein H9933_05110 [Candidatus Alistipes merdavium]|nr:hypothetical protein [Candidatus Alistipes merdavium]